MEPHDYIRIEVPRVPDFVAVLRRVVDVVAMRAGLPGEDLLEVRQALGEACNQAVAVQPFGGFGDVLRLTCSRHPSDATGRPAIRLLLEAPEAVFFREEDASQPDVLGQPSSDASAEGVAFSASLISRLMENVACYDTERGTTVSSVRHLVPRANAVPAGEEWRRHL